MAAAALQAVETLRANATAEVLGYFIWWGTWEAQITPANLRRLFLEGNLNPDLHLPDEPTPALAFRRAVRHGVAGQDGVTAKLIADNDAQITYGLREDVVDKANNRAPAKQFARITWIPGRNRIISDDPNNEVVQRIVGVLPTFRDHFVSDDVRKAIKSVLSDANAVPVTGRGGNSCFAPSYSEDLIASLEGVIARIPNRDGETATSLRERGETGGQTFVAGPCPAGGAWQVIGEAAGRSEFSGRVDKAVEELASFQERTEAHLKAVQAAEAKGEDYTATGPRLGTLAARLGEYRELRDKIESYSAALSFRADDLLSKLDAVKTTVSDLLGD